VEVAATAEAAVKVVVAAAVVRILFTARTLEKRTVPRRLQLGGAVAVEAAVLVVVVVVALSVTRWTSLRVTMTTAPLGTTRPTCSFCSGAWGKTSCSGPMAAPR
jgi:hypothetical protein